jgi:hypothetical protein
VYLFKFFNSPVEGGKLYVQLIDLRLIIGSGYSPHPLRSHFVPPSVYHASVNIVYGGNWKNARLTSTDRGALFSESRIPNKWIRRHPPARSGKPAPAGFIAADQCPQTNLDFMSGTDNRVGLFASLRRPGLQSGD